MNTKKLFAALLLMLVAFSANVMTAQQMPPIPVDDAVRIGKLDNGLTYYIRHNNYPEQRVSFYIAQRVGSMQEEENQRGLAHFLEHMAFNGSEHFNGNGNRIIDYTRSLGVSFGLDLNAETGYTGTVYHMDNVPSTRQSALDSCLLILKDWSHGLLLTDEEIDNERGVIHQEWRMRNTGDLRNLDNMITNGFPGSKFANRMPIGLMEIVDNFPYKALRDYYDKWYRPDNQALIVVGDIDVDYTEAKIREMFKDIPAAAANAPQVEEYPVPDNEEPIYIYFTDKELSGNIIEVMFKHEPIDREMKSNTNYLIINYVMYTMCEMFNSRFNEMSTEPDCPFISSSVSDGKYIVANTMDALDFSISPKEGQSEAAIQAVLTELQRVKKYGFTASEYDRVRQNYQSYLENRYNTRDKVNNTYYCRSYRDNFLDGEPIMSIETHYQLMNMIAPQLSIDIINQSVMQMLDGLVDDSGKNMIIACSEVDKDGVNHSTIEGLRTAVDAARNAQIEEYVDNVVTEPLLTTLPKAGKIVKEKENTTFGYKELELSNGAHVILKKTDFNENEIRMFAGQRGGMSLYGKEDRENIYWLDTKINTFTGLGQFGYRDLTKALTGKTAWAELYCDLFTDNVFANSSVKDLETMFQLVYLKFTDISKDEKEFNSLMIQHDNTFLKNKDSQPMSVFMDTLGYVVNNKNWRGKPFTSEDLQKVNYDRILQIAKERTANAANYTFVFIGAFDEDVIRPYIEQYIASLPAQKGVKSNWVNMPDIIPTGQFSKHFTREMAIPQGWAAVVWVDEQMPYTLENQIKSSILGQVLNRTYLQKIREDAGAAYSAEGAGLMEKVGDLAMAKIVAFCQMKPEFKDETIRIFNEEMVNACSTIDPVALKEAQEYMLKSFATNLKSNTFWGVNLLNNQILGVDNITNYEQIVKSQTPETIAAFARRIYNADNRIEVVMTPAE